MSEEEELNLPGIKRGIAIGIAFSVSIILIAILAFFAIRRRRRRRTRNQNKKSYSEEDLEADSRPQEKRAWMAPLPPPPPPPPVEADARTIYELDATEIPELPTEMCTDAQVSQQRSSCVYSNTEEESDLYARKLRDCRTWSFTLESESESQIPEYRKVGERPPLLTLSSGEVESGRVSSSFNPHWDVSSQSASPLSPVSQPQEAHFMYGRQSPQQLP